MKKIVVLLLILGLSSSAFSAIVQNLVKTTAQRAANAPNSQDWFTAANWNGAVGVPQNDTALQNNGVTLYGSAATSYNSSGAVDAIVIANGNAVTGALRVGSNTPNNTSGVIGVPAALMMNSGTLTVGSIYSSTFAGGSGFMSVGSDSGTAGTSGRNGLFYMNGGDIQALFSQATIVIGNGNNGPANGCYGKMWMTGGTIECGNFQIGKYAGVTGEVYLSGGTITTNALTMGAGTKLLDITGSGKIIITGDVTTSAHTWDTSGWLTSGGDPFFDAGGTATFDGTKTTLMIPEPATLCLLSIGALSLLRRKK